MTELTLTTIDTTSEHRTGEALYIDGLLAAKWSRGRTSRDWRPEGWFWVEAGKDRAKKVRKAGEWLRERGLDFKTRAAKRLRRVQVSGNLKHLAWVDITTEEKLEDVVEKKPWDILFTQTPEGLTEEELHRRYRAAKAVSDALGEPIEDLLRDWSPTHIELSKTKEERRSSSKK